MKFRVYRTSNRKNKIDNAYTIGHDRVGDPVYGIDISSLEELIKLSQKEGELIIGFNEGPYMSGYELYEGGYIEIYDSYRE